MSQTAAIGLPTATEVKSYLSRIVANLKVADVLTVLLLAYISLINLNNLDISWDTLAYHLPYAGLRTGIIPSSQFVLPIDLHYRYLGFPPLVDYVQGALWWLFGRPEAAALIAPISILFLSLYLRVSYGVGMIWTMLIFLAVPALHTALNTAYVDLWTNAFFVIHLFAAVKARRPCRNRILHTAISFAALAVAVNSKEQFFIVGALSFSLFGVDRLIRLAVAKPERLIAAPEVRDLLMFAVLAPIIFLSPIRNLIVYANPIYPIAVKVAGHAFPGLDMGGWDGPTSMKHVPQAVRYVLSQLDLEAVNMRADGYVIDQGNQPSPGLPGYRMGGSLAFLLLMAIAYLVIALRRPLAGRPDKLVIGGFATLVAAVALMPGSNELRYFSFVEISAIVSALYLLTKTASLGDETAATLGLSLKIALACSAVYVASLTGWNHLKLPTHQRATDLVEAYGIGAKVRSLASTHSSICYPTPDKMAFFYSPALNARLTGKSYKFAWTYSAADCPAGSAIVY